MNINLIGKKKEWETSQTKSVEKDLLQFSILEGVAPPKNLLFLQVEIPKGRGWMEGSLSNIGCWKDGTDRAGLIKILAFAHHILQQETWNKMTFM